MAPPSAAELVATLQKTQRLLVQTLQEEFFMDDVQPPDEAFGWSYERLKAFMESGGEDTPVVKATPTTTSVVKQSTNEATPSWGMGMFDSVLTSDFTRVEPGTLVVLNGKVPLASKGPIIWLAGTPENVGARAVAACAATAVPVGSADSNAQAVELSADADGLKDVEALISSQSPNFKWVAPRDLVVLPMMRRASTAEAEAVVRAASLLAWHRAHAYSGADGSRTTFAPGTLGRRRKLSSGRSLYPRVDPVALVLVVSADGDRVLLGRQKAFPPSMFTCVSGFVEHGESAERAAAREVRARRRRSKLPTIPGPSWCVCSPSLPLVFPSPSGARGDGRGRLMCGARGVSAVAMWAWVFV
jgi:hypothetical protein